MLQKLNRGQNESQKLSLALGNLRERLERLIARNDAVDFREQLERQDFVVDLDMQAELKAKALADAETMRAHITGENRGKELIRERIKQQCYDGMEAKG